MLPPEVVAYYDCGDEQDRLTARAGRLEWARTWHLLQRHLPVVNVALPSVREGLGPAPAGVGLTRAW